MEERDAFAPRLEAELALHQLLVEVALWIAVATLRRRWLARDEPEVVLEFAVFAADLEIVHEASHIHLAGSGGDAASISGCTGVWSTTREPDRKRVSEGRRSVVQKAEGNI